MNGNVVELRPLGFPGLIRALDIESGEVEVIELEEERRLFLLDRLTYSEWSRLNDSIKWKCAFFSSDELTRVFHLVMKRGAQELCQYVQGENDPDTVASWYEEIGSHFFWAEQNPDQFVIDMIDLLVPVVQMYRNEYALEVLAKHYHPHNHELQSDFVERYRVW